MDSTTLLYIYLFLSQFDFSNVSLNHQTPPYLKEGDTIAITAPAGVVKSMKPILKAKETAEKWGLEVKLSDNLEKSNFYFAGSDKERIENLQTLLDNKNIKGVWCARGGYGTSRIIDSLNFDKFKENPKWVVGFSDVTVLHNHIHNLGIETIHGEMPINFTDSLMNQKSVETLHKALFGEKLEYNLKSSIYNRYGTAEGKLVGGNLTLLQHMLGSVSAIDTKDKILFIEEVGEHLYHIDRLLISLKRNQFFKHCKGIIIGGMDLKKNGPDFGKKIEELILDVTGPYPIPVIFDFPAGHQDDNRALILGRIIKMDVKEAYSTITF